MVRLLAGEMKPILTMDFETDPFKHGETVAPFACGLYDGKNFASVWSAKCAEKMVKHLATLPPSIIYMHNGGRFDIFFLMRWLEADMRIINGRVVVARIGEHEIRDSYAILPFPLAQYKKDEIDIQHLNRDCRDQYRAEILSYLQGDCVYLHELVTAFHEEFGDFLTIGSAAMSQLQKFHEFERGGKALDNSIRSRFFFGGRVQCFQSGVINTPLKIYDVNSMYPHVMKNFRHPTGRAVTEEWRVGKKTAFVVAEGVNAGAFPLRTRKGIDFTAQRGRYACTIHEWNAALELDTFRPTKVLYAYDFDDWISFDEFVDHFFAARIKAKKDGDAIRTLFYKLILNSAYGKFAQNPENFSDFCITQGTARMPEKSEWTEHMVHQGGEYVIWKKATNGFKRNSYFNVAIGASITGAARSLLMHAVGKATNPIYVDTDSIICRELSGVDKSDTGLGAWKLEAKGDRIAIAGKKMYVCFDGEKVVKKATKGARLSSDEIVRVAEGETVTYRRDAPNFKLDGAVKFVKRRIKRTI